MKRKREEGPQGEDGDEGGEEQQQPPRALAQPSPPPLFLQRAQRAVARVSYARPRVECVFGLDEMKRFVESPVLGSYVAPAIGTNLGESFDAQATHRDDASEPCPLDPILRALALHHSRRPSPPPPSTPPAVHFVTFRNNLNKILNTVCHPKSAWSLACTRRRGVVFLDVRHPPGDKCPTAQARFGAFCGRQFEHHCVHFDEANKDGHGSAASPPRAEFCAVMRCQLGDHGVLMAAEVDCEKDGKWVELKTSQLPRNLHTFRRFKLSKWWVQSFLAGVPFVVCAFLSPDGVVSTLRRYTTEALPAQCEGAFDPQRMLSFASQVLWLLRTHAREGGHYDLRYDPASGSVAMREVAVPGEGPPVLSQAAMADVDAVFPPPAPE